MDFPDAAARPFIDVASSISTKNTDNKDALPEVA